jgi:NADPH:quinone reductase-like Zn-dependent oxidoreductase
MNPFDWKFAKAMSSSYFPSSCQRYSAWILSAKVAALGEGTSRFKVGDRVMTMSARLGAYAEYIVVDESILPSVPPSLSNVNAATLPIPALTAWQALHTHEVIRPGATVLIHGASGIVGAFAVQFAKAEGAKVIGTASGKNRGYVMSLGADGFIDYEQESFEEHVKDVDLVLDFALIGGSMNTTERSWGVLKANGAIVSVGDPTVAQKAPKGLYAYFPTIKPDASQLEAIDESLALRELK